MLLQVKQMRMIIIGPVTFTMTVSSTKNNRPTKLSTLSVWCWSVNLLLHNIFTAGTLRLCEHHFHHVTALFATFGGTEQHWPSISRWGSDSSSGGGSGRSRGAERAPPLTLTTGLNPHSVTLKSDDWHLTHLLVTQKTWFIVFCTRNGQGRQKQYFSAGSSSSGSGRWRDRSSSEEGIGSAEGRRTPFHYGGLGYMLPEICFYKSTLKWHIFSTFTSWNCLICCVSQALD